VRKCISLFPIGFGVLVGITSSRVRHCLGIGEERVKGHERRMKRVLEKRKGSIILYYSFPN